MDVGELNRIVVFKTNSPSALGAGQKDVYSTLITTRGSLKMLSGSRTLQYGDIQIGKGFECWVRYQVEIENNLRSDVKLFIDGRKFTIASWEKIGEKRFYYKFILNEVTN